MSLSSNEKKFVMRMPASMHARIKAQAVQNRRSMNSEMLVLLEAGQLATTTSVQIGNVEGGTEDLYAHAARWLKQTGPGGCGQ